MEKHSPDLYIWIPFVMILRSFVFYICGWNFMKKGRAITISQKPKPKSIILKVNICVHSK